MLSLALVTSNRLLQAMSDDTQARLACHLEHVALPAGTVMSQPGSPLQHLYFPSDCILSVVKVPKDKNSTEVSMVGNEGAVGISLFMGGVSSLTSAVVQSSGSAYRLPAASVHSEFIRHEDFMGLMLRYTQARMAQISQTAACNRHHSVDQQLARWLLHSLDRVPGSILHATQGQIAKLLGVRREGVTEAAGKLQARGAIAYLRGRIDVLDRALLEELCCECYAVVRREFERLLSTPKTSLSRLRAGGTKSFQRGVGAPWPPG